MKKIVINRLSDKKLGKWKSNGLGIIVKDEINQTSIFVSRQSLLQFLGKSYDMYLNFEQVTIYYYVKQSEAIITGIIHENPNWIFYGDNNDVIENCGKWMYFFDENWYKEVQGICKRALDEDVVKVCKHTKLDIKKGFDENKVKPKTGVVCFYVNGLNSDEHRKVIEFLLENNLIRRTKSGRLYNISFKFDYQTISDEYGEGFNPIIKLSDYVNLKTGKFK